MLVPIILKKLPRENRKNLARGHSNTQWTLTELQKAILQGVRILEVRTDYSTQPGSLPTPTASLVASTVAGTDWHSHKKSKEHQTRPGCVYYRGSHASSNCTSVIDITKHMEIISHDMLCFNYLVHHKISQCKSKFRCQQCNRRHHTSLCTGLAPPSTSTSTTTITGTTNGTITDSSATSTTASDATSLTTLTSDPPLSSHWSCFILYQY